MGPRKMITGPSYKAGIVKAIGVSIGRMTSGLTFPEISHPNHIKNKTQLLVWWQCLPLQHVLFIVPMSLVMLAITSMPSIAAIITCLTSPLLLKLGPVLCNVVWSHCTLHHS